MRRRISAFLEGNGFYLVALLCAGVVICCAFLMNQSREEGASVGASQDQSIALAARPTAAVQSTAQNSFTLLSPVSGTYLMTFSDTVPRYFVTVGYYMPHVGIDIRAEMGTIVCAASAGTVIRAENDPMTGLTVEISHSGGYVSCYQGLASCSYVQAGDTVQRGQTIGHVGNGVLCEKESGAHLHFELRKNGQPLDPQLFGL